MENIPKPSVPNNKATNFVFNRPMMMFIICTPPKRPADFMFLMYVPRVEFIVCKDKQTFHLTKEKKNIKLDVAYFDINLANDICGAFKLSVPLHHIIFTGDGQKEKKEKQKRKQITEINYFIMRCLVFTMVLYAMADA